MARKSELIEPVYMGKVHLLHRAAELLAEHGIACRHTSPRRARGILRVSRADAETARSLLPLLGPDGIITADEAVHFFCPKCEAPLPLGAIHCPECDEFVGDAHAM